MAQDTLQSKFVRAEGGLNESRNIISIAEGEAVILENYEPDIQGGYARIQGFAKYDANQVGTGGNIIGISVFSSGVIACEDDDVYYSEGAGWTRINSYTRPGAVKYRFAKYFWQDVEYIIGVDGANYPFRYDGTVFIEINSTSAPLDAKFVAEFKQHIFYGGYSSNPGEITWCVPNSEEDFTVASGAGSFVVGDEITGLLRFRDDLIIFCKDSIHRLTGSSATGSDPFTIEPITEEIGCLAPDSIKEIGGDIMWLAPDGIRTLAGTTKIGDVELALVSKNIQTTVNVIATYDHAEAVVVHGKTQYRLFYHDDADAEADALGVLGSLRLRGDERIAWEWTKLKGIKPHCCDSDFINNVEYVVHGGHDGYVYQQENGNTFNGSNIKSSFTTAEITLGDPAIRKALKRITFYYRVNGAMEATVSLRYDKSKTTVKQPMSFVLTESNAISIWGTGLWNTMIWGANPETFVRKFVNGSGFTVSLSFSTDDINPSHTIEGYLFEFAYAGRR